MSPSKQATLEVSKLVATGNDFVFVDGRKLWAPAFADIERADLAKKLCDRHFGIGADGLVVVESKNGKLEWDFYNNDGSHAEMCGNATRCMGRWLEANDGGTDFDFKTAAGSVHVTADQDVSSRLDFVEAKIKKINYVVEGERRSAFLVNTGVPHAVRLIDRLEDADEAKIDIEALRFHPDAGERGANVTFLELNEGHPFRTVTFERGVEDFTLSCGTGVLAAAAVGLTQIGGLTADVETPGGLLRVFYKASFKGVVLQGPAQLIFKTQVGEEILR